MIGIETVLILASCGKESGAAKFWEKVRGLVLVRSG